MVVTKNNLAALTTVLAGIGAFNWIPVQFFDVNLVSMLSMGVEPVSMLIYGLAGVGGAGAILAGLQQFDFDY